MERYVCGRACCALPPQPFAALTAPGGRGCAPLPRTPTRGKLSLQAVFCALTRTCALRAVFLCWRMELPARVRACCALPPQPFALLAAPEGRGYAPLPRTPTRGKLSLQAFFCARCARVCASRRCFFVLAHAATRPLVLHPASSYHARMFFRRCVSRSQNCRAASALSPRRLM